MAALYEGDDEGTLGWLMGRVREHYGLLIWRTFEHERTAAKVFVHTL